MLTVTSGRRRSWILLPLALLVAPAGASASGIDVPENGALVLGQGGTDVGLLDTAYSLQFNPAGMAFVDGLDVRVETLMINPGNSFQISDGSKAVTEGSPTKASNLTGLSYGPQVMAVYHPPALRWLAFGLGVWGPPGVTTYRYADPRPACCDSKASNQADSTTMATPNRYDVIQQHTVIAYPSVGVAIRPVKWFSIGATLQYVVSSVQLSTALQAIPTSLANLVGVDPNSVQNDAIATVNVNGNPRFTAIIGAVVMPIPNLTLGVSVRPMVPINATGSLGLELGTDPQSLRVGTTPANPTAELAIKLPTIVRAGAAYKWQRLSGSLEYVWSGWSCNNQFTLSTNAAVTSPLSTTPTQVGTLAIPNNWRDTNSVRAGVSYDILRPGDLGAFTLQAMAGFIYDQNAIPAEWQKLPYVTGDMYGPTVGLSVGWHGLAVNAGFAYYVPQTFTVTDSAVVKPGAPSPVSSGDKPPPPPVIGNGTYTTNLWSFAIGLSYTGFGGHDRGW